MIEKRQFYINGSWVDPKDGRDHQVINPSTEEACATISLGGQADTDAAVAAAKAATCMDGNPCRGSDRIG